MTSFLQLILFLAVIITAAKASGYISTLFGQPSVLGELIIGLIIGPSLLDLGHMPFFEGHNLDEIIKEMAEIGVLFLMFVAGLELHLSELAHNSKVSAYAGILGVVLPIGLGWITGLWFGYDQKQAIFLGLTLGATSVSISAQTLMELGVLRSRVGLGLLGAAVFDDVMVILLLSAFLALATGSAGWLSIVWIFIRMIIFLALSIAFGMWVLPRLVHLIARLPISQGILALGLVVLFLYGAAAELIGGMAAITGAFLAGLMFARSAEKEQLERGMSALSYGLFVPIFFVNIGLSVNARTLDLSVLWFMIAISVVAIVGKLFGAGLGASLAGFSRREAVQLGAGMVSRGEVGLILASVGISQQLVNQSEFSAVVGMVLVSTLITPPMLRGLFKAPRPHTSDN